MGKVIYFLYFYSILKISIVLLYHENKIIESETIENDDYEVSLTCMYNFDSKREYEIEFRLFFYICYLAQFMN